MRHPALGFLQPALGFLHSELGFLQSALGFLYPAEQEALLIGMLWNEAYTSTATNSKCKQSKCCKGLLESTFGTNYHGLMRDCCYSVQALQVSQLRTVCPGVAKIDAGASWSPLLSMSQGWCSGRCIAIRQKL